MGSEKNINNYIKIALYGDSLSMARENIIKNEERYFFMLLSEVKKRNPNALIETIQRSKASISSSEMNYHSLHDSVYYNWQGAIAIIHLGIVDCSPRPVNIETREKISKLPGLIKKIAIKYLHRNRRKILLKGKASFVTSISDFKQNYIEILGNIEKLFDYIVIINIAPTNTHTEHRSPGLSKSIQDYNNVIAECVADFQSSKIKFIDLHSYITTSNESRDNFIVKEDGHHITPLTHKYIYQKIIEFVF